MNVIKKDGSIAVWDIAKVVTAVTKSANRAGCSLTDEQLDDLVAAVEETVGSYDSDIPVELVHGIVIQTLRCINAAVAESYENYRNFRKDIVARWENARQQANETIYQGDRENANFDSTLVSTKGSLVRGHLTKELYKQQFLNPEETRGIDTGFIYIHDLRDLIFNSINCCLFDMENLLSGGFEMAGMTYKEPKSLLSALQVIGDITLVATAQQFGGFTIAELDRILVPYYKKSYDKYWNEGDTWGVPFESLHDYATAKADAELMQGIQSLEMKVNSVPSSRGDTAFTTISFGLMKGDIGDKLIQAKIAKAFLTVRMTGQGDNAPVVFPKLVYLHAEHQHKEHPFMRDLFDYAIECSSKCMYPDFLSLDAGTLGEIYQESGLAVSPMGCRAFLSDYRDDSGNRRFIGRANIGAVSLNLPLIYQHARVNGLNFYKELDHWLEVIRQFLLKRYAAIANTPASTNPLGFTQGGLLNGYRKPNEKIGDIVNAFTASFGVTALHELRVLTGSDAEVNNIVYHIKHRIEEFKQLDGKLYAIYGTPAESLCGTQLKQFRALFGKIQGVSDREYFTNSFHQHVSAEISPIEKQDQEFEMFHVFTGGRIQYVRLDNPSNRRAVHAIVKRGLARGFYQGVNFTLAVCDVCGHRPTKWNDGDCCTHCGSETFSVVERTCGYLGYRVSKGSTRFNEAKMAEIKDRKSM